jgi:leader peptidase (prepilin peptidase)/N-methyltransferase
VEREADMMGLLLILSGICCEQEVKAPEFTNAVNSSVWLPGIIAGASLSIGLHPEHWLDTVLGVVIGGGLFFVIIVASGGGMGGGDMKLGAMMGAFLGWKLVLLAILLGVFAGGAVAIALLTTGSKGRKDPVPFGPFLALGAVLSLLWGNDLLGWYLSRFFD